MYACVYNVRVCCVYVMLGVCTCVCVLCDVSIMWCACVYMWGVCVYMWGVCVCVWASQVAQTVKNLPAMRGTWV